jgi:hypothetical protein
MTRALLLIPAALLVSCSLGDPCTLDNCTDLGARRDEIAAVYGGSFTGEVTEGAGGSGGDYEPCSAVGQPFELDLSIGELTDCDAESGDGDTGHDDCTDATHGWLRGEGSLLIGEASPQAVAIAITVGSWDEGIHVHSELWTDPEAELYENFEADPAGGYLGELALEGFTSTRRLTEPEAEETIWQLCRLPVSEHVP